MDLWKLIWDKVLEKYESVFGYTIYNFKHPVAYNWIDYLNMEKYGTTTSLPRGDWPPMVSNKSINQGNNQ